ncbi:MAG TPA: FHA domain-containing protein [Chloroflexia bacterium]|nr:FHA domain-containing protein [Chloroflexia bacterium]
MIALLNKTRATRGVLMLALALTVGAVLLSVLVGAMRTSATSAPATPVAATPPQGLVAAEVAAPDNGNNALPAAQTTNGIPAPVQTGVSAPPVQTGGPAGAGNPGAPDAGTGATPAGASGGLASSLPLIVGALVVLGLAALGFMAWRRSSAAPVALPVVQSATRTTTLAPGTDAAARVSTASSAAPMVAVDVPVDSAPAAEVRCPNCDALNPPGRRFCDDCGQDLRPAAVGGSAAALPAVDEASLPYLETLSRMDEQLEFVLARNTVTLGRALDNDIVIDDQFTGWQTVSAHHARLARQADGFVLDDLQSENGTFVNGARTGQNLLEDGMTIAVGKVEFVYRVPQP